MPSNALPEVVILSGARTPMAEWVGGKRGDGQNGGALAGLSAIELGAGRIRKEDKVDPAAGFVIQAQVGAKVRRGDPLVVVHALSLIHI